MPRLARTGVLALVSLLTLGMAGCGASAKQQPTRVPSEQSGAASSKKTDNPQESQKPPAAPRTGQLTSGKGRVPTTVGLERVERDADGRLVVKGIAER